MKDRNLRRLVLVVLMLSLVFMFTPTHAQGGASVSGPTYSILNDFEYGIWFNLTGFAPNSMITVTNTYSSVDCATGVLINRSWTDTQGPTNGNGDLTIGYIHGDYGTYNFNFSDDQGNSVPVTVTVDVSIFPGPCAGSGSGGEPPSNPPADPPSGGGSGNEDTSEGVGDGGSNSGGTSNQPPPQTEPINNSWGMGNTVGLCLGTQIRVGSGLQYSVHTVVPVNNWPVTVIDGPRYADGYTWWDISRSDGGSGWVREDQANCRPTNGSNQTSPSEPQQPNPVDLGTDVPRIEATTSLNIRSCPSINCSTVGSIQPGAGYEVIGKNRNAMWLQIAQGWVCRNYTRDNGLLFLVPFTSEMTENCSGEHTETPTSEPVETEPVWQTVSSADVVNLTPICGLITPQSAWIEFSIEGNFIYDGLQLTSTDFVGQLLAATSSLYDERDEGTRHIFQMSIECRYLLPIWFLLNRYDSGRLLVLNDPNTWGLRYRVR